MSMHKYSKHSAIIFDDHKLFAEALLMILERLEIFESVATVHKEKDLRVLFNQKQKGSVYLFLDYYIPECNVYHLITDINRLYSNVNIVIISSLSNAILLRRVMNHGVKGFLSKSSSLSEMMACFNSISENRIYMSPEVLEVLKTADNDDFVSFTSRELEIINFVANGMSIQQIADTLKLSKHTVITHRRNMMEKANCNSIIELLAYMSKSGIVGNNH